MNNTKFKHTTVTAVVIANMIGTGVFTSLGFQLLDIQSGFAILLLWVMGGIVALCGSITYAELGAALPRSGGEYNFLSEIYHPCAGFISGWVSATIGFAAPIALTAITFSAYLASLFPEFDLPWIRQGIASALVLSLAITHSSNRKNSGNLQVVFTILKIVIIVLFSISALFFAKNLQPISFTPAVNDIDLILDGSFAISLIYVSYAYTGWNAATYLSSEIENPQKNLPKILITGTAIVMLLYVMLNYVFLKVATIDSMQGKLEIGYIAAQSVFGDLGAKFTGLALALLLISTVSAMTLAGPRVLQVIGEDFPVLNFLSKSNKDKIPTTAIYTQSAIAIIFILSSSFESILIFAGFTLALNSFATVMGVFFLRIKKPDIERPYRIQAFPLPPLIYLSLTGWTLYFVIVNRPIEGLFSLAIIASGGLIYFISTKK
ncbi:MAG: amino acid permease [Woeseiaceae bacterium]|jgi:basic amino acid/polyamine antiporter, APA family|nr:amino acid permease [Woeseiaceae bacterium]MDG1016229.1 amino acid permease [Woeseiaceae bacterium]MDG1713796.1 amino acid permease [Woeseiaceae bacterium]MDG1866019.1 amino acid permease [Woeseiaceae bacterium]